jgi:hypothetical protein
VSGDSRAASSPPATNARARLGPTPPLLLLLSPLLTRPSWPASFLPHAYTTPSAVSASECWEPADTATAILPASSSTGSGDDCLRLPLPQRPYSPLPQESTRPSRVSASM